MADLEKVARLVKKALDELGEPSTRQAGIARTKLDEAAQWLEAARTNKQAMGMSAFAEGAAKAAEYGKIARQNAGLEKES